MLFLEKDRGIICSFSSASIFLKCHHSLPGWPYNLITIILQIQDAPLENSGPDWHFNCFLSADAVALEHARVCLNTTAVHRKQHGLTTPSRPSFIQRDVLQRTAPRFTMKPQLGQNYWYFICDNKSAASCRQLVLSLDLSAHQHDKDEWGTQLCSTKVHLGGTQQLLLSLFDAFMKHFP